MKGIVVLNFDLPTPEAFAEVLKAIDPPSLPHFDGEARIAIPPSSDEVIKYLDSGDGDPGLPDV